MNETCGNCGKYDVSVRRVTRSFGAGTNLLVIEELPLLSCPHCGESYFDARTLHEIERIKTLRRSVAVVRDVPVAQFSDPVS